MVEWAFPGEGDQSSVLDGRDPLGAGVETSGGEVGKITDGSNDVIGKRIHVCRSGRGSDETCTALAQG
jgi:hypothetical protein